MQNTKPKQPYYRKPVTTLRKLEENVIRISSDIRMGGTTKQFKTKAKATKHAKMWASWINLTGKFLVVKV